MAKWFTADLHLDHQKLLDGSSRGLDYPNVDDWNSDIIDNINRLLKKAVIPLGQTPSPFALIVKGFVRTADAAAVV